MARYALETLPGESVNEALRAELTKLKGRPLIGVIGSLGVRRDPKAASAIAGLLNDGDALVVQASARALGRIGTPEAAEALLSGVSGVAPENFLAFVEGIGRAVDAAMARGEVARYEQLFDSYADTQLPHHVRAAALRGAILSRGPQGLGVMREALLGADYILFAAAVKTSFEIPGAPVTQVLAEVLPALTGADQKVVVAGALGQRGDKSALPALTQATAAGAKPVRLAAVRAVAMLSTGDALPVFLKLMTDADREVAQAAKDGLAGLPEKAADDAALKLLAGSNPAEQLAGIELIGRRRMTGSVPALVTVAERGTPPVRGAALKQVGELGTDAEIPTVVALLVKAGSEADINAAEQALITMAGKSKDGVAVAARVAPALEQAKPQAKAALLNVLAAIGGPGALKAVRGATGDSEAQVRTAAIRALGSWKTADAGPALLELASQAGNETERAISLGGYLGLAGNGDLPAGDRLTMCGQAAPLVKRPEDRKQLLAALGQIPAPEALQMALPHLEDPATRAEAGAAIVLIAEKLLQGDLKPQVAASLVAPLGKVAASVPNADVTRKAGNLAEQAKKKAGQ
jgi:HEAT repeat protein